MLFPGQAICERARFQFLTVRFTAAFLRPRSARVVWFLLFFWPTINLLLITGAQHEFGVFSLHDSMPIAIRLYLLFGFAYLIREIVEAWFPAVFPETHFGRQLSLYVLAFALSGVFVSLVTPQPTLPDIPRFRLVPILFLLLQILLVVAATTIFAQRESNHAMVLNLRQAQVNLLRSQSNPHFLFNTLNLLASEIGRSPESAQEIVYDLADLLRESMKAGERSRITIAEEMHLATLYLQLQQKRFPDRFSFSVEVEPELSQQVIPSLLLQPGVENVIKHVVARTREQVHLTLTASREGKEVVLTVADTGGGLGVSPVKPGDGLRILRDTLELYYPGVHVMTFDRSENGATLCIRLPTATDPRLHDG
jgi:two-component system LytT family sensor kinase